MRAALLPIFSRSRDGIPREPIIGMWLRQFDRWQHTIDKLIIKYNETNHGEALTCMINKLDRKYEYLLFVESDAIILDPTYVDKCFSLIESGEYDYIGSPRMSCHSQISEAARIKWGLDYGGEGDKGPNFWPNFFFCKHTDLLKTDLNFGSRNWKPGEYIDILDHTVQGNEIIGGDTFVWMSIQLRGLKLKYKEIPQYHSSPYDILHAEQGTNLWDGKCPWFHMGSLSGYFCSPNSEIESNELERRAAWHELSGLDMTDILNKFGLRRDVVNCFKDIYLRLL